MLVRTDDEVYRIDAVWLGPPRATFPWRARYVSYGVGLLVMMLIMFVQRRLGVPLDFFSVAWSLLGTVAITKLLGRKITYERPFGQVVTHFWSEVTGPRRRSRVGGGPVRSGHVRVRPTRSRPPAPRRKDRRTPTGAAPAAPATRSRQQPTGREVRAIPVRTSPETQAWASRRSRPAGATATTATKTESSSAWRTGRKKKEARRGRA